MGLDCERRCLACLSSCGATQFSVLVMNTTGFLIFLYQSTLCQWRTEGEFGGFNPPTPEIPKVLQNRAKLNPIVKTVKNC